MPFCHGVFRHCGCDEGRCENSYTRHFLIKKVKTCQEEATRCVPAETPACGKGH
jgi:hypothetical protein